MGRLAIFFWWLGSKDTIEKNCRMHSFIRTGTDGGRLLADGLCGWMVYSQNATHGNCWKGRLKEWNTQTINVSVYVVQLFNKGYTKWNDLDMILIHINYPCELNSLPGVWYPNVTSAAFFLTLNQRLLPCGCGGFTAVCKQRCAARSWKIMDIPRRRSSWSTCWTGKTRLLQTIRNQPAVFHVVLFRETLRVGSLEIWWTMGCLKTSLLCNNGEIYLQSTKVHTPKCRRIHKYPQVCFYIYI